jgi:hypothetical protein
MVPKQKKITGSSTVNRIGYWCDRYVKDQFAYSRDLEASEFF